MKPLKKHIFHLWLATYLLLPLSFSGIAQTPDTLAWHPPLAPPEQLAETGTEPAPESQERTGLGRLDPLPLLESKVRQEAPDLQWSLSFAKFFWAAVIFSIGFLVIKYSTRLLEFIAERRAKERLTIKAAIPVMRIIGWTFVLYFIIARIFAPPIETVLALTASLGIAVGFASQDILKNIFGGIMILFDRPFGVGDKVRIGDHYGEVLSIGLRTVRLVTPDDSVVSVPNAEVAASAVSNANSGAHDCMVVAEFFLTPDVDLAEVQRICLRAAMVSRYTYMAKPIRVNMRNEVYEGRSLIKVRLKAYVFDIRYEFIHITDLTRMVMEELRARGLIDTDALAMTQR